MRGWNIYVRISLKILTGGEKSKKHKVFFEDPAGGHNRIQFDGCPYIIVGRKVYDCQHGVDRHAKEKQRNQKNGVSDNFLFMAIMKENVLDVYTAWLKQFILQVDADHYMGFKQTTKNLNCPATVVIREILRFPNYKVRRSKPYLICGFFKAFFSLGKQFRNCQ